MGGPTCPHRNLCRTLHTELPLCCAVPLLQTFRSKEISKSNVVDDMVQSNALLYK